MVVTLLHFFTNFANSLINSLITNESYAISSR